MGLGVLRADAGAGPAANAAASIIDDHDHAIELAIEIVVFAVAGAEDFTRFIDAVKMHDLARADFETAAAADAGRDVYSGEIFRHPSGAVAGDK